MKSKLNKIEFELKLKENIKIGLPKLKLSIFSMFTAFGENSKPFYGLFENSSFTIIENFILFPTFVVIKGNYENVSGILKVNYKIEPSSKFYTYWMKLFPIIFVLTFNLIYLLTESSNLKAYILIHLFIVFIYFFSKWKEKLKSKKLESKFIEIFEII